MIKIKVIIITVIIILIIMIIKRIENGEIKTASNQQKTIPLKKFFTPV
jgi:hypothetical protein